MVSEELKSSIAVSPLFARGDRQGRAVGIVVKCAGIQMPHRVLCYSAYRA